MPLTDYIPKLIQEALKSAHVDPSHTPSERDGLPLLHTLGSSLEKDSRCVDMAHPASLPFPPHHDVVVSISSPICQEIREI